MNQRPLSVFGVVCWESQRSGGESGINRLRLTALSGLPSWLWGKESAC